jgi:type I restriction enzyme S subunit
MAQEVFKEWFVRFRFPGWQKVKFVDSELGKIPEGWEISKIGEKLTTILGGTPSTSNKSYWENGDIPWINSGAINDFPIINPTNFITKKGLENSAAKLMPVKTVVLPLVISIGKPVNISMLVKEMSGNQSVVGIVGNDKITPEYIYCWVQYKKQEIYGSASGGAQQHINKNIIDSTLILIPKGEILDSFNQKVVSFFDTIIKKAFENQTLAILRDLLLSKLMSGEIKI